METPKGKLTLSPARLAACRANVRKAHEANRTKPMSPARRAALEKAVEANRRNWRLTPARGHARQRAKDAGGQRREIRDDGKTADG